MGPPGSLGGLGCGGWPLPSFRSKNFPFGSESAPFGQNTFSIDEGAFRSKCFPLMEMRSFRSKGFPLMEMRFFRSKGFPLIRMVTISHGYHFLPFPIGARSISHPATPPYLELSRAEPIDSSSGVRWNKRIGIQDNICQCLMCPKSLFPCTILYMALVTVSFGPGREPWKEAVSWQEDPLSA